MRNPVPPRAADTLKPLLLPAFEKAEEARRAKGQQRVSLSSRAESIAVLQEY